MRIGAFTYWYNMSKFDYPCEESVRSVLPAVDELVICECRSEDDTLEIAKRLQAEFPDKIGIVRRNWVRHYTQISSVANFAMDALDPGIDYAYQIQADEVLHDDSVDELRALPERMEREGRTAASVHFLHFMANYETTFPFNYENLLRVARRNRGWEIIGDGVQFAKHTVGMDFVPPQSVVDTGIRVFHYGKVREAAKGWQKEHDFMELYRDIGFPDPKIAEMAKVLGKEEVDYVYLFESHVKDGTIRRFEGAHPTAMAGRMARFKSGGYEQFVSAVKKDLEIKWGTSNVGD